MAVRVVAEDFGDRLKLVAPSDAGEPAEPAAPVDREHVRIAAVGLITAWAAVVSARLVLLLATLGGLTLAVLATLYHSTESLWSLGLFSTLVIIPLVILSWTKG